MNIWANSVITAKGLSLMSKLIQGSTLKITRAVTGSGYVTPGKLQNQTEVTGEKQALNFRPVSYPEVGKCTVPMHLTNDGVTAGYLARQVGIYAEDPDEGEILYIIAQSQSESTGTEVPSASEMPGYSAEWTFYLQYGQADGVAVTVDPTNTVNYNEMSEYVTAYVSSEIMAATTSEIEAAIAAS